VANVLSAFTVAVLLDGQSTPTKLHAKVNKRSASVNSASPAYLRQQVRPARGDQYASIVAHCNDGFEAFESLPNLFEFGFKLAAIH
jgi:hypothetical protein